MTVKTRRAKLPAPKTYEECDAAILRLGITERILETIQAEMSARLALVKAEYEDRAAGHKEVKKDLSKGIQTWCDKHREELLKPGVKTHRFSNGEVTWRTKPPRVAIANEKKGGAEKVIAALRRLRLSRLLRVKTEIDKEAILKSPGAIAGIEGLKVITDEEQFEIAPLHAPLVEGDPS